MIWNHLAYDLLRFSRKLVHRDNLNAVLWISQKRSRLVGSASASTDTLSYTRNISRQLDWNHIDSILNKWNVFGKLNRLFAFCFCENLLRRRFSFTAWTCIWRRDISKQHLPVQRKILGDFRGGRRVRKNRSDRLWRPFLVQVLSSFDCFRFEDFGGADFDRSRMFRRQLDAAVRCWFIPFLRVKYKKAGAGTLIHAFSAILRNKKAWLARARIIWQTSLYGYFWLPKRNLHNVDIFYDLESFYCAFFADRFGDLCFGKQINRIFAKSFVEISATSLNLELFGLWKIRRKRFSSLISVPI